MDNIQLIFIVAQVLVCFLDFSVFGQSASTIFVVSVFVRTVHSAVYPSLEAVEGAIWVILKIKGWLFQCQYKLLSSIATILT